MNRRYCRNPACGKPLGSQREVCYECGGSRYTYRGSRSERPTVSMSRRLWWIRDGLSPRAAAGLGALFDGEVDADGDGPEEEEVVGDA